MTFVKTFDSLTGFYVIERISPEVFPNLTQLLRRHPRIKPLQFMKTTHAS